MRANRLIRKRGTKYKSKSTDLDITSLLDVLVILLVFLIQNYNASGIEFNISPEITLPVSESQDLSNAGVMVQVSATSIWVDDKTVLDLKNNSNSSIYDQDGQRIIPLFNELVRKKNLVQRVEKTAPSVQKFTGLVNLIVDKSIKYSFLKKILYTSAEAGYAKYKFVVLAEE